MKRISKGRKRYIDLATRVAGQSTYGKFRHGAVLVRGGSVINVCHNKENFCSFGKRFRNPSEGNATLHAELGCILGLEKNVTQGATIYVVRINRAGQYRMSKPCNMCRAALQHCGINRVFYSTEDSVKLMRL